MFDVENEQWALKPMNCPGHCLIFGHRERSYRELPIRMAEFGILHRNESSGALTGLTRVRRFVQDDTHIFCTAEQVEEEIKALFAFLQSVYGLFGFTFNMNLSTMPQEHLGDLKTWQKAENQLTRALDSFQAETGTKWELKPGDGAFYGPKIDVTISDALKRDHQCATIQLDFCLPQQFNLEYCTEEQVGIRLDTSSDATVSNGTNNDMQTAGSLHAGRAPGAELQSSATTEHKSAVSTYRKELTPGCARPVMIHRAIYGSFERFIAILCEHFGGKWPFWLSPRQILIVPVMPAINDYVFELQEIFRAKRFHADVDTSSDTMGKKIVNGRLQQYNFILVVGAREKESRSVNIRNRDDETTHKMGALVSLDNAIERFVVLRDDRRLETASE